MVKPFTGINIPYVFPEKPELHIETDKILLKKCIEQVMDKLNNRPRKSLGFKTPNEVFFGIRTTVALAT